MGNQTKRFRTDKPTIGEIMRERKPAERTVELCIDASLIRQYDEIRTEIDRLKKRGVKRGESLANTSTRETEDLQLKMDALEEEIESVTVAFIARDPGRKKYERLIESHKPTDPQRKDWAESGELRRQGPLQWNPDTFVAALLSLVFIEPTMTIEEADQICDEWGNGEILKLFNTALFVCNEVTTIPKFRSGTEPTADTALNSITALNGESPTPDS